MKYYFEYFKVEVPELIPEDAHMSTPMTSFAKSISGLNCEVRPSLEESGGPMWTRLRNDTEIFFNPFKEQYKEYIYHECGHLFVNGKIPIDSKYLVKAEFGAYKKSVELAVQNKDEKAVKAILGIIFVSLAGIPGNSARLEHVIARKQLMVDEEFISTASQYCDVEQMKAWGDEWAEIRIKELSQP